VGMYKYSRKALNRKRHSE